MPTVPTEIADIVLWRAVQGGREGEVVTGADRDTHAYLECQNTASLIMRLPLKTVRSVTDTIVGETSADTDDAHEAATLILEILDPENLWNWKAAL